jgi:hypothetical protein
MDISRLLSKESSFHKLFPKCITRSDCDCFEEIQKNLPTATGNDLYIIQCIELLEQSMYLIKIHQNKETIVEIVYTVKVTIDSIKSTIQFLLATKKKLEKVLPKDQRCYIDFPSKPVTIHQYLQYVDLFCNYHFFIINMMYYNNSKLSMEYLKNILEVHLELIFIFQQFQKLQKLGYTYSSETTFGSKNCIQLYWS